MCVCLFVCVYDVFAVHAHNMHTRLVRSARCDSSAFQLELQLTISDCVFVVFLFLICMTCEYVHRRHRPQHCIFSMDTMFSKAASCELVAAVYKTSNMEYIKLNEGPLLLIDNNIIRAMTCMAKATKRNEPIAFCRLANASRVVPIPKYRDK